MEPQTEIDFDQIARKLGLRAEQVAAVTGLLDEGNTVPFITRYRKERTDNLDEEQIRQVQQLVGQVRQLQERATTILRLIDSQGKLTPELQQEILAAESLKRLEDLYLPYRPKRKSRAMTARQRGLEPLAERIWNREIDQQQLADAAAEFVSAENELPDVDSVLQGAADILAEKIGEDAEVRQIVRKITWRTGELTVSQRKTEESSRQEFRDYYEYHESVQKIPPHRVLALNRGERMEVLRIRLQWDAESALSAVSKYLKREQGPCKEFFRDCLADALQRLIQPSLEREIRREITEKAEIHAVSVFAQNLKKLLLQPPLRGQRVLAIDPGFRTGCKIVVLDECGRYIMHELVYVTGSEEKRKLARVKLADLMREHNCSLVAIGNGTACRETEELVSEMIAEHLPEARYLIVNEAGASIYSTGSVAREELAELDATVRGTVSIGRRLQDPLSELVKIEPQHIGVGLYQHDVNAKMLQEQLEAVIESCVNYVGVDLNTASPSLLKRVSGLNQVLARRVVEWREQHGSFRSRKQLLEISGLGDSRFTQAAGFLKIAGGDEPLDGTWIHPESYPAARKLVQRLGLSSEEVTGKGVPSERIETLTADLPEESLAEEMAIGLPTLRDILEALSRPGRDPRTDLPGPLFKQGVLKISDLQPGMELQGTVLNVVDFGVFVDVGLKDSALVHISQMSRRYVRNPHDLVGVGDVVTVWVLQIDSDRRRVSLTMIAPGSEQVEKEPQKPTRRRDKESSAAPPPEQRVAQAAAAENQGGVHKRTRKKPARKQHSTPQTPLSDGMKEGTAPLKGFDQLKQFWNDKKSP